MLFTAFVFATVFTIVFISVLHKFLMDIGEIVHHGEQALEPAELTEPASPSPPASQSNLLDRDRAERIKKMSVLRIGDLDDQVSENEDDEYGGPAEGTVEVKFKQLSCANIREKCRAVFVTMPFDVGNSGYIYEIRKNLVRCCTIEYNLSTDNEDQKCQVRCLKCEAVFGTLEGSFIKFLFFRESLNHVNILPEGMFLKTLLLLLLFSYMPKTHAFFSFLF